MKPTLKLKILEERKKLTQKEIKEKNKKIFENLKSLREFKSAKNIMFYVSFSTEVDTHEIIKEILASKEKTIIVPYVVKNYPILQLSELKNFYELEPKTFGILEPRELYIREFNPEKLDLVIIPGVVFDKKGYRIGYGYGYYDRFLKILKKGVRKIGLAYEMQMVDEIPKEKHDVPVDSIVTENRILSCIGKQ
ncbi:5-formyltetrahydrofolate cyclo-ligase [Candidatus Woesearchaeota archaeon]|nr:5-formyltetrahydrofolate cyclo-ligase [Candidatus Woesearchaeota archaeon]